MGANVIIKSDERRRDEAYVMQSFGAMEGTPEQREAAEIIAARSREAIMEGRR